MTATDDFTAIFAVARDEDGEWDCPHWTSIVRPNAEGELHHGSRGATLPDTVVVQCGDEPAALADAFAYTLDNQYCWDCEYYLVLRVRAIVRADAWARLPWAALGPGDVFFAYDKFHGSTYSRTGDDVAMSYGGDWSDLQAIVDAEHPLPGGPRPTATVSDATLLRAVREGDVAQVRALLAAGANPDAGLRAPDAALRAVSVDRNTSALLEAVGAGELPLVELLLAAGAAVDGRPEGCMTPLQYALLHRHVALVPLLLRHGADPDASHGGRSARTIAAELGVAELLASPRRGPT